MWEVLNAKFKHSAFLTEELLATNDARLVEASPYDAFWGMGSDGLGRTGLAKC